MKNKFSKSLFLVLSTFGLLITSCSNSGKIIRPVEPETPGEMEDPESILDDFPYEPTNPINFDDKAYYYNDHINDVDPNFKLIVAINPELDNIAQFNALNYFNAHLNTSISITDRQGLEIDLATIQREDTIELYPMNDLFIPGEVYVARLLTDTVVYKDKDPKIKKLYFDVKEENNLTYEISNDVKYFDISKVVQFAPDEYVEMDPASEEAKEWFENHTYDLIYATNEFSSLREGDNFAVCPFKNNKPTLDDRNSFYGCYVSSTKVQNGYKVTYKNADLSEIYKDNEGNLAFKVNVNEEEVKEFRDVHTTFDEEGIKEEIANDPQYQRLVRAALIANGRDSNVTKYDVLNMLRIEPSFSWSAPKFVIQIKVTLNIPINEAKTAALYIEVCYQYISELSAGGSVEVKKFLGVPYWIEAKSEVTQTVTHKFTFKIGLMRNFKPDDVDTSDMKKMIKNAYQKLEDDPAYFMDRRDDDYKTSGNERIFPIAELNFPFGGYFSLFVSLDVHLTLDLRVLLEYNYVNQHTSRILSFSTSDGVENTANTDSVSCYSHTIDLLGGAGVQLGLLLRAGLCVTGLSKLFGMGFSFEGGIYADFKGMVGVTWGSEETRFVGGVDLDIGIYGQISAFIDFLVFHPKYDFAKGKKSFFGYDVPYTIINLYAPDEINIDREVTDISSTSLLTVQTFSVSEMAVDIKNLKLTDEVKVQKGTETKYVKPLTMTSDSSYLIVDEETNTLMLPQYVPTSFTAHLTITVNWNLTYLFDAGEPLTKTVTVNYNSAKAREVSIKGVTDVFKVDQGRTFKLPDLKVDTSAGDKYSCKLKYNDHFDVVPDCEFTYDNTYYDFVGFSDGEHIFEPGTEITVGENNIVITPILKVIIYHTATFYNGKGEVISVSRVREFNDAIEPTMEQIMNNMDGYVFYGWDRSFKNLSEDIKVYGIYYKVGVNN